MKLIEDDTVGIEAVLIRHICRQHLVLAVGRVVDDGTGGLVDGDAVLQRWAKHHHIHCHIKYNLGLIDIGGTAIDFSTLFTVCTGKVQRNGSGKLRLAHFLWYLYIGCCKLPVAVRF